MGQPSLVAGSSEFGTYIGGGRIALLQRRAGQPQPDHRAPGERRPQGPPGRPGLPEPGPPPQLGRDRPAGALYHRGIRRGAVDLDGQPVVVDQELIQRQTNRDFQAIVAYPFSTVQRLEFSAGYSNISFDNELRTQRLLRLHRRAGARHQGGPAGRSSAEPRHGAARPWCSTIAVRRDRPHPRAAVPLRGEPDLRLAQFRRRAGGLPALFHAGSAGHARRCACCTTAATARMPRTAHPAALPRLPGTRARLPGGLVRRIGVPPGGERPNGCPVFDQLLGSRIVVGNARAPDPAVRRPRHRLGLLWRAADRFHRVRRRGRRMGPAQRARVSGWRPRPRSTAPEPASG